MAEGAISGEGRGAGEEKSATIRLDREKGLGEGRDILDWRLT